MPATKTKAKRTRPANRIKRLPKGPNGGIELLLIHNVENLGSPGDVVEVRPGYAKNYLIPHGLAAIATDHHKRMVEKHRVRLEVIEQSKLAGLKSLAAKITQQSVTIEANANDDGHLYGSVGAPEIVAALKKNDISFTEDQIRLAGPLKELGLYTVKVHFGKGVEGDLKVWVVPTIGGDD